MDDLTLVEQVTDRLLSEQDVMVLDIRTPRAGVPDLLVMVPRRMPVFLYLKPSKGLPDFDAVTKSKLDDMQAAWFDVEKVEDIDFLMNTIQHLRMAGEIRQPKTAASEGFEQQYSDEGQHAVARSRRHQWQD